MFCVNCGKDIPENSYICPYCKFVLNKDYEQTYNSSGKEQAINSDKIGNKVYC